MRCVDSCAVSSPRSLRPAFAAAAIREAEHWWLGDAAEFRAIIEGATAPSYGGAWRDRNVFRDFTTAPPDHARFAGAMHIRTLAPRLEKRAPGSRPHRAHGAYLKTLASNGLWACARESARRYATKGSFFIATDAS